MVKMLDGDTKKRTLARAKARIVKKLGIWVYHGHSPDESIPGLINRDRKHHQRRIVGAFRIKRLREGC